MVTRFQIACILFLWGTLSQLYSQNFKSYITVNHDEAYIGQPIQMTVFAYTSTWFTSGVDIENIQIEGALTVYFRSVSNRKVINGKDYSGIDFIYNVFPTQAGTITIPELTIHVESPKPGGYKGMKHVLHTTPKPITIKPVPTGYNPNNWLVSNSLSVHENWNASLKQVKVGDVLQRSISRTASGTLGEFIPAVIWDSTPGVSIYPKRAGVNTNKTKTYVSASREDSANYLFEKAGRVTLPKIEFVYWNYTNGKFYKKTIDSITFDVAPNPDLKMLAGIKKELQTETIEDTSESGPFLIFGLTVKQFLEYLLSGILLVYILYKLLPWFYKKIKQQYLVYQHSESYAFKGLTKSLKQQQAIPVFNALNHWRLKLQPKYQDLDKFMTDFGSTELQQLYKTLQKNTFTNTKKTVAYTAFLSALKTARKNYKAQLNPPVEHANTWLNPIKKSSH